MNEVEEHNCVVLFCVVLCCVALCCVVLFCGVLCCSVLCCLIVVAGLHDTALLMVFTAT
jgi:hypothetical protein